MLIKMKMKLFHIDGLYYHFACEAHGSATNLDVNVVMP